MNIGCNTSHLHEYTNICAFPLVFVSIAGKIKLQSFPKSVKQQSVIIKSKCMSWLEGLYKIKLDKCIVLGLKSVIIANHQVFLLHLYQVIISSQVFFLFFFRKRKFLPLLNRKIGRGENCTSRPFIYIFFILAARVFHLGLESSMMDPTLNVALFVSATSLDKIVLEGQSCWSQSLPFTKWCQKVRIVGHNHFP